MSAGEAGAGAVTGGLGEQEIVGRAPEEGRRGRGRRKGEGEDEHGRGEAIPVPSAGIGLDSKQLPLCERGHELMKTPVNTFIH